MNSWTGALSERGYNAVLQPQLALRLFDLIAFDRCTDTLVGPTARLLDNRPALPSHRTGPATIAELKADDLSAALGKAIVDSFTWRTVGTLPNIPQWNEADFVSLTASELEEDVVPPEEMHQYLRQGVAHPNNAIFKTFVLRNARLCVVLKVLRAKVLKFSLMRRNGESISRNWWHLHEALAPDLDFSEFGGEVTVRSHQPVLLAVSCLPVVPTGSAYSLVQAAPRIEAVGPGFFQLKLWPEALLPQLQPWNVSSTRKVTAVPARPQGYREYVALPEDGIRFPPNADSPGSTFFIRMHQMVTEQSLQIPEHPDLRMWVLHSISELEPKRVRMLPESAAAVNALHLGFRLEPVLRYGYATLPSIQPKAIPGAALVTLRIVCAKTSNPIDKVNVTVFVDWKNETGATGTTDANGEVHLALGSGPLQVDRIYVEAPARGFWGAYQTDINLSDPYQISLDPVDPLTDDHLRKIYGTPVPSVGAGVKVAVIDGGVGPHPDLTVAGGENVLTGAMPTDTEDWGDGHGTHVAGIIAGRGSPRGVAPGVELYSFRVYGSNGETPSNYDITYALILAGREQCDVVNLSLGLEQSRAPRDETMRRAVADARERGCVLVAAAGNSGKSPITLLADYVSTVGLAVSAVGRRGTYPVGSLEETDIESTLTGMDPDDFVAMFSSYGQSVSLAGPGVGVVSTVPKGGYRPLSGTSMAAPAIAGFVARIIQQNSWALPVSRDRNRVIAILNLVVAAAQRLGFPHEREGSGLPQ